MSAQSRSAGSGATHGEGGTVALAYSGGLDTRWCVGHLVRAHGARVVTVTVDVGGLDADERERLAISSRALGASDHVVVDARAAFFDEVLRHLVAGNVLRGHLYPLCVGAERTLQAREVIRVARDVGATAIAHGCTAAGNDQVRFEIVLRTLAPDLDHVAPIRDLAPSRDEEVRDLESWGAPAPATSGAYSINSGLWGVTIGGRETLTSQRSLPESAWVRTRGAFEDPIPDQVCELRFTRGVPAALDGEELAPVALVERLDALAARHGIGRGIHLGDTVLGIKGRVAFEAPAATVLIAAHRELEKLTLSAAQQRVKDELAVRYGDLVHEGLSLEPVCRDIERFFASTQERVSGTVKVRLAIGHCAVEGVDSPHSLMASSGAAYGETVGAWSPADAAGFARVRAVATAAWARAGEAGADRRHPGPGEWGEEIVA